MLAHGVGNEKLRVLGPSVGAFDKANLFLAQWLAVRRRSVLSVRRAVADVAVQNDESRTPLRVVKDVQGVLDAINVVGIAHAQNVPAITQKSGRDVLRKGDACVAFDGDVVVVIDPAEIVQGEMARQRRRFRSHALHHAAVAANRINVVTEDLEVGAIVTVGEPCLGNGHAYAGGDTLPKRSGRSLNPGNQMVLGMTWSLAAELAEVTNIIERNRGLPKPFVFGIHRAGAGEVKHRPQQHRGVTVGEQEPIAVRPNRILRVETHDPVPKRVDKRRQRHRRAGMPGLRLLDRIDRQRANAIDRQLVQLRAGHRSRRIQ
jgi:hypothetical protein